jgi:hypothetical protein
MSGAIAAIGSLFGGGALGTVLGTAALGLGASQLIKSVMPSPKISIPEMKTPEIPSIIDMSKGEAEVAQQRRRAAAARTKTIYTSPLGLSGSTSTVGKKTLLGG